VNEGELVTMSRGSGGWRRSSRTFEDEVGARIKELHAQPAGTSSEIIEVKVVRVRRFMVHSVVDYDDYGDAEEDRQ